MGLTFAQAAQSYKDPYHIKQDTDRAMQAYCTLHGKLPEVQTSPEDRRWIEEQMQKLALALEHLTNTSR
jgi:hypothetical protein